MSETLREQMVEVLSRHQRVVSKPGGPCWCGEWPHRGDGKRVHTWMDHVADALLAATAPTPDEREVIATRILNTVDPLLPGHEARMACVRIVRGEDAAPTPDETVIDWSDPETWPTEAQRVLADRTDRAYQAGESHGMSTAVQAQREADADAALEALNCQSCGLLLDMPVPEWCTTPASHHAAPTPDEVGQVDQWTPRHTHDDPREHRPHCCGCGTAFCGVCNAYGDHLSTHPHPRPARTDATR